MERGTRKIRDSPELTVIPLVYIYDTQVVITIKCTNITTGATSKTVAVLWSCSSRE